MSAPRDVFLTIGKQVYSITTPLDDKTLDRVKDLIDQACGSLVEGMGQEDRLALACLQLAYALDTAARGLDDMLKLIERADREALDE